MLSCKMEFANNAIWHHLLEYWVSKEKQDD